MNKTLLQIVIELDSRLKTKSSTTEEDRMNEFDSLRHRVDLLSEAALDIQANYPDYESILFNFRKRAADVMADIERL
jgi:hypothetical protein